MTKIELLEKQIADLDYDSFAKLREWFIEFDQANWDKKLESDSNSGKLDFLINAALAEHQAGETIDRSVAHEHKRLPYMNAKEFDQKFDDGERYHRNA